MLQTTPALLIVIILNVYSSATYATPSGIAIDRVMLRSFQMSVRCSVWVVATLEFSELLQRAAVFEEEATVLPSAEFADHFVAVVAQLLHAVLASE